MTQIGKGKGGRGGGRPVFIHFSGLIISPLMYACMMCPINPNSGYDVICQMEFMTQHVLLESRLCVIRVIACIFYSRGKVVFFSASE